MPREIKKREGAEDRLPPPCRGALAFARAGIHGQFKSCFRIISRSALPKRRPARRATRGMTAFRMKMDQSQVLSMRM
jgi:hypothetical protein